MEEPENLRNRELRQEPAFFRMLDADLIEVIRSNAIGTQAAVVIALSVLKRKPVSHFEVIVPNIDARSQADQNHLAEERDMLETLLVKNKLHVIRSARREGADLDVAFEFAREKADLDAMMAARAESNHEEIGRLFGFPQTAIAAYLTGETVDYRDLPSEVKKDPTVIFAANTALFKLSKLHWQEELRTIYDWAEIIRKRLPNLYSEIMNSQITPSPLE